MLEAPRAVMAMQIRTPLPRGSTLRSAPLLRHLIEDTYLPWYRLHERLTTPARNVFKEMIGTEDPWAYFNEVNVTQGEQFAKVRPPSLRCVVRWQAAMIWRHALMHGATAALTAAAATVPPRGIGAGDDGDRCDRLVCASARLRLGPPQARHRRRWQPG